MATGVKLTKPQLRALRILEQHEQDEWVRESNRTYEGDTEKPPTIYWQVADNLEKRWLAEDGWIDGRRYWRIRAKGRQALREHDAKAVEQT